MLDRIKPFVPSALEPAAVRGWFALRPLLRLSFAGTARYCVLCDSRVRRFLSHGPPSRRRNDVMCPICLSHDRHRSAWIFLSTLTDLASGVPKRCLHFAPEPQLSRRLGQVTNLEYVSADLHSPHATIRTDITAIDSPDAAFDFLYCSHVLEHVPDDVSAMREIFRVLKPGGWAVIQVPLSTSDQTLEDSSVTDPAERERLFWQSDHVRLYGSDFAERLARPGFDVRVFTVREFVPPEEIDRQGLWADERIFYCTRP